MLLLCSICLQNGEGKWRIEPHKWEGMYEVLYVWIGVYACIYTLICMYDGTNMIRFCLQNGDS